MTGPTLERLERILVLVPWLLAHPGVDVEEVTRRFGIDREALLSDLDVLGYCGLPGYGGGDLVLVWIEEERITLRLADFFARPLALTVPQALQLLLAARVARTLPLPAPPAALDRAARAMEELLGTDPGVTIDLDAPGQQWLGPLSEAVRSRRVVGLRYRSRRTGEVSERDVEPASVVAADGAWYLRAWCRRAEGPRDFRLDGVLEATLRDEEFAVLRGPAAGAPPPRYEPTDSDLAVVLDVARPAWRIGESLVVDRMTERGRRRRLWLRTDAPDHLARLVLAHAPHVAVVQPAELLYRVRGLAGRVATLHAPASTA